MLRMKLTADIARALGLRDVDALVVADRQPGVAGRDRQAAYRRRQDRIVAQLAERAATLTRAEEMIRTWFGLELSDLVAAADRDEAIARLRAIPDLAPPPPAAVPLAGRPAPVDQAEDPSAAAVMVELAQVLNGDPDPPPAAAKPKPRPRRKRSPKPSKPTTAPLIPE